MREADAEPIRAALQDWDIVRNLARVPWPYGIDDARAFVARARQGRRAGDECALAIDDGGLAGIIGLHDFRDGAAEIGYWLARSVWGRGYATEALATMLDYGFGTLGLDAISAGVLSDNPASMRVLAKAGFVDNGPRTCATLARGDLPAIDHRITQARWRAAANGRAEA